MYSIQFQNKIWKILENKPKSTNFNYIFISYSGSDIAVVVKDAVMQPVRLLQTTNKF